MKPGRLTGVISLHAVLALVALLGAFPFLWLLLMSIKRPVDAFAIPPLLWFRPNLSAYAALFDDDRFLQYLTNSAIVSVCVVAASLVLGCLGGYAVARVRRRVGVLLLAGALLLHALPRMAVLLPFYRFGQTMGLYDTRTLLVLAMTAINLPFTVWMFANFFREIPEQLEQAAMIDGCTRFGAFRHVVLPTALPGLITTALFALFFAYNEFLLPAILTGPDAAPMPVLIADYAGSSDVRRWPLFAAAACLVALPLVLILLTCQRYIVRGLVAGAVKG